jgi:hypothetical protein
MNAIRIYDPAMCCSTGLCGPDVNPTLVDFAAFLHGLDKSEYAIERYNLSQTPGAYVENQEVAKLLQDQGTDVLPIIYLNDKIVTTGAYPTNDELAGLLGIDSAGSGTSQSECCSGGCCS